MEPPKTTYTISLTPNVWQDPATGLYHARVIQTDGSGDVTIRQITEGFSDYGNANAFAVEWADALMGRSRKSIMDELERLREMLKGKAT